MDQRTAEIKERSQEPESRIQEGSAVIFGQRLGK